MVKVDIHNREKNLERNTAKYISRLFQEDARRFINDHLANGYSFGRVDKYLTSLVSIRRLLNKPFKTATQDECKAFVAGLAKSKYAAWSQHDFRLFCGYISGGRIGEILPLQLKNVTFDKNGAVFRVTGKTGDRRIRILAKIT